MDDAPLSRFGYDGRLSAMVRGEPAELVRLRARVSMATFEYRQAEEIRDAFARHGVRYLFLGKSGAILLGFPDTTQDADVFLDKSPENGRAAVAALRRLGFHI